VCVNSRWGDNVCKAFILSLLFQTIPIVQTHIANVRLIRLQRRINYKCVGGVANEAISVESVDTWTTKSAASFIFTEREQKKERKAFDLNWVFK